MPTTAPPMDSHNGIIDGATSLEVRLPLKMIAGLIAASRTTSSDLIALPTTMKIHALGLSTHAPGTSMIGALVIVVTIQIGLVRHTHALSQVQDSKIVGTFVVNVRHTEMATGIEVEATKDETSTAAIESLAILL